MFTGIIEEQGTVKKIAIRHDLATLTVEAGTILKGCKVGDSIAVDGVCLTVALRTKGTLSFEIMRETLKCTTLGQLSINQKVNLERSLKLGGRLGGHFVTGHIDCIGIITDISRRRNAVEYLIKFPRLLRTFIVPKGSVALDGVSLTVGKVKEGKLSVHLIPHTLKTTTMGKKTRGDSINIETDILAKYILSS